MFGTSSSGTSCDTMNDGFARLVEIRSRSLRLLAFTSQCPLPMYWPFNQNRLWSKRICPSGRAVLGCWVLGQVYVGEDRVRQSSFHTTTTLLGRSVPASCGGRGCPNVRLTRPPGTRFTVSRGVAAPSLALP